jgi:uncharacterized protein YhfF
MTTRSVESCWSDFLDANPDIDRSAAYQTWYFSNNSASARELAELVISLKKTATASQVSVNEIEPEKAPIDDGYSVITSFEGEPLCVIKTIEIRHVPFNDVDAQFAFDEGEGDQTLHDWLKAHSEYFTREAKVYDVEFDDTSLICCERFQLLYPIT